MKEVAPADQSAEEGPKGTSLIPPLLPHVHPIFPSLLLLILP